MSQIIALSIVATVHAGAYAPKVVEAAPAYGAPLLAAPAYAPPVLAAPAYSPPPVVAAAPAYHAPIVHAPDRSGISIAKAGDNYAYSV